MNRLNETWSSLRASYWFVPGCIVLASMGLALLLVQLDSWKTAELARSFPRLFGASAQGSRSMLSAVATSMITVAGVVFSITVLTLSLTATQYSPRVLRNFMRDGPTQVMLGAFLGIFAYCLLVLRSVRGAENGDFIPSLAVLGGLVYALVGVALLIFYVHHIAQSIQASAILERIAADTAAAIDRLFPQELGQPPPPEAQAASQLPPTWAPVASVRSGYLTNVDPEALLRAALQLDRVVRLDKCIGDFVAEGETLLLVSGGPLDRAQERQLRECFTVDRQRTVEQDAVFGFQQVVDIALKALSPGINDPTTARMCLDQLGALLAMLARREMPASHRESNGQLRLIARSATFDDYLALTLTAVARHSRGDLQVLDHTMRTLDVVAEAVANAPRRLQALLAVTAAVRQQLSLVRPHGAARPHRRRLRALEQRIQLQAAPAGR